MAVSTQNTDILTAVLGKAVVLAYGRHLVAGNVILMDESDQDTTILYVALGEGPWDLIEQLWINGAEVNLAAPGVIGYHFHKGLTGEAGTGGVGSPHPFATDGDQKIDAYQPAGVTGLTFSHTCYLALSVPFDQFAPEPGMPVLGIYKTRKVSIRNAAGAETSFAYSDNPAWCIADLLTSVRGIAVSRVNWQSFIDAAATCDALINPDGEGNVKRFLCNVAFTEEVDFDEALAALLITCRGALMDADGLISLRIDQTRSSVFDFSDHPTAGGGDNIVAGTFEAWRKDTHAEPNRLELLFRDTNNGFQVMSKPWNHAAQQTAVGRVIPAKVQLGNLQQQQAERIGNYLLTRAIDNNLFCRFAATQKSFKVMPGDVVRVKHDAAPWTQAAGGSGVWQTFEVLEASERPDGTRQLTCQQYSATTYPDTAGASANLVSTTFLRRAPDGTTDTAAPSAPTVGTSAATDFEVVDDSENNPAHLHIIWHRVQNPVTNNWMGVYEAELTITHYKDAAGTVDGQTTIRMVPADPTQTTGEAIYPLTARWVKTVSIKFRNYFGLGAAGSVTLSPLINTRAPDGTKDVDVPDVSSWPHAGGGSILIQSGVVEAIYSAPGSWAIVITDPASIPVAANYAGAFAVEFEITSVDQQSGLDSRTNVILFEYKTDPLVKPWRIFFPNRTMKSLKLRFQNYFGWSAQWSHSSNPTINISSNSAAQDVKPPSADYDRTVQHSGFSRMTAKAGGNAEYRATDASAVHDFDKIINAAVGYKVGGAAADKYALMGDGTKGVFRAIAFADLPTSVLQALIASKKVSWGQDQLASGSKQVTVGGMTTVEYVLVSHLYGATPTEYLAAVIDSGNQFTARSSNASSGDYFHWLAIGS